MRSLLTGYAGAFNRRHRRVGHLFQNRYKSVVVDEETHFELVRYLHLNPSAPASFRTSGTWTALSVDCIDAFGTDSAAYRFIGKALSALAPADGVAIMHPATHAVIPCDEAARVALQAEDVLQALGITSGRTRGRRRGAAGPMVKRPK